MSAMLPRRGGRPIEVDGHALRWWVRRSGARGCPDCDTCVVLLAHTSRSGALVRVYLPEAWREDVPITPSQIAALARKALARGWLPGQGDGEFAGGVDQIPRRADAEPRAARARPGRAARR